MIDQIESILFHLRNSDSKKPMLAEALAEKLEVSIERFEEMMNVICNIVPAPVNRAYREVTENLELKRAAFKGYVYWPTGVIDRAHWKDFKPASSKQPAQPIRTELSTQKVSADTYETPIFGANPEVDSVVDQIAKIIDTPTGDAPSEPVIASVTPDYSDKPKAYQILKYIESHPDTTSKPIEKALKLTSSIKPYISGYLDRGFVIDESSENGRIYRVTKPVDDFYRHHKPYEKKSSGATQHDSIPETKATPKTNDDRGGVSQVPSASVEKTDAADEIQKSAAQRLQDQVVNDPAVIKQSRYRFAYTNDCCLLLFLGGHPETVELDEFETTELIEFISSIITPIGVSI